VTALAPGVAGAVLGAALLHAVWNSMAHAVGDRVVGFGLIGVVDVLLGGTLVAIGGLPPAAAWPYIAASAVTHVAYNQLLLASFQLGEFSQVYPLARGTSPWVVALVSALVLRRPLPVLELIGVLAVSGGLIGLVFIGGRPDRSQRAALGVAFVTGLTIALYTVIDGLGVTRAPLVVYIGWTFLLNGPPLLGFAVLRRRGRLPGLLRRYAVPGMTGGVISIAAYAIVLWAQQISGALAPIAALREASIVFGALIGAIFLGERLGRRRAIAAAVVLAGILVLSLG
jgi:drug/metabolite transporter (DMT)-like permease